MELDRERVGATVGSLAVPVLLGSDVSGRVLVDGLTNKQTWVILGALVVAAIALVVWLWRAGDR